MWGQDNPLKGPTTREKALYYQRRMSRNIAVQKEPAAFLPKLRLYSEIALGNVTR
jgi:hypothetical protein